VTAERRTVEHTLMFQEAASASQAVREQLRCDGAAMTAIGTEIRRLAPRAVVTCARGSSDHAATFAKYLIETEARVLTASAAPSVSSVYGVSQDLRGCLFIALSQSGRSPDLLASVAAAKAAGATILALCNDPDAPLIRLVAAWTRNAALEASIATLPRMMDQSWSLDWSAALPPLESAAHLYVVGRGLGLGAAQETALKCKETCGLHAEAFSSAELRHGPYTLLGPQFPALLFAQADATQAGVEALAADLVRRGVPLLAAGVHVAGAITLPTLVSSAAIAPILLVQSAYRLIATLALRRGYDPDHPAHLRKVTETV